MKIKYLGTAAAEGWPALFCSCQACEKARQRGGRNIRTRSQALVDGALLLDFPADSYSHMLQHGLRLGQLCSLLITHSHDDHFYPMDLFMRMKPYAHGLTAPLRVYGNQQVCALLEEAVERFSNEEIRNWISWQEATPFQPFETEGYRVTPLPANHMKTEQALFYAIEKGGKALLYAHDTGALFPEALEALKGFRFQLASLDCTHGPADCGGTHMGLEEDASLRRWMLENGCAGEDTVFLLNHFSHNGGLIYDEMKEEAARYGFLTSYDGMEVEF